MAEPRQTGRSGKSLADIAEQQRRIMRAIMREPEWYNSPSSVNRMGRVRDISARYQRNMVNDAYNRGLIDYHVSSVGGGYAVRNGNMQSYVNSGRANTPVSRRVYMTDQERMSNQRAWELAGERPENTKETGTWNRDYWPRRRNNRRR